MPCSQGNNTLVLQSLFTGLLSSLIAQCWITEAWKVYVANTSPSPCHAHCHSGCSPIGGAATVNQKRLLPTPCSTLMLCLIWHTSVCWFLGFVVLCYATVHWSGFPSHGSSWDLKKTWNVNILWYIGMHVACEATGLELNLSSNSNHHHATTTLRTHARKTTFTQACLHKHAATIGIT